MKDPKISDYAEENEDEDEQGGHSTTPSLRHSISSPPHLWHLIPQAPTLECVQQRFKSGCRGPDFTLVVHETSWLVIGYGIIVLAHVSQHSQKTFFLRLAGLLE